MPDAVGRSANSANVGGDGRTKLVGPAADGLVADVDSALGQQLFNVAQTQGETVIMPDSEPDDLRAEPVSLVRDGLHSCLLSGDWLRLD